MDRKRYTTPHIHSDQDGIVRRLEEKTQQELERWLKVLGPEDFEKNKGIEIPDDPTFLRVSKLIIKFVKVEGKDGVLSDIELRDVIVFFCHTESDAVEMRTVKDGIPILPLLKIFEKRHPLVMSLTCNEASARLLPDLIYPVGNPPPIPFCFNHPDEGIILEAHQAYESIDGRPVFHIPEKYQSTNISI